MLSLAGSRSDCVGGDPAHPALVFLLRLEIASIILLFGGQVIAECERLQAGDTAVSGRLKTEVAHAEVR